MMSEIKETQQHPKVEIAVKNFGPITEANIDLRPLTVFVGPTTSLQKEQVGIWHFQKNAKVEEIPYNRIDGVEPMEYLDVAEDLYNRSARLQNRLEETKGDSERKWK